MVNRGWLCGLVGILCLGMAGCWDRVEIEERGFVVGIAIDNAQDQQGQTADLSDQAESLRKVRYVVTYQFVNPEGMQGGGKSSGGKGPGNGESSGQPMFNISTEGKTLLEASRDMVTKASRTPYIEHLKMIIISERIAKEGTWALCSIFIYAIMRRAGDESFCVARRPSQGAGGRSPKREAAGVVH